MYINKRFRSLEPIQPSTSVISTTLRFVVWQQNLYFFPCPRFSTPTNELVTFLMKVKVIRLDLEDRCICTFSQTLLIGNFIFFYRYFLTPTNNPTLVSTDCFFGFQFLLNYNCSLFSYRIVQKSNKIYFQKTKVITLISL